MMRNQITDIRQAKEYYCEIWLFVRSEFPHVTFRGRILDSECVRACNWAKKIQDDKSGHWQNPSLKPYSRPKNTRTASCVIFVSLSGRVIPECMCSLIVGVF